MPNASPPPTSATPLAVPPLEAARLLSICITRVYRLMRAGELRSFHSGRSRRITMASIKKFIARQIAVANRTPGRPASVRRQQAVKPEVAAAQKRRARTDQLELPAE